MYRTYPLDSITPQFRPCTHDFRLFPKLLLISEHHHVKSAWWCIPGAADRSRPAAPLLLRISCCIPDTNSATTVSQLYHLHSIREWFYLYATGVLWREERYLWCDLLCHLLNAGVISSDLLVSSSSSFTHWPPTPQRRSAAQLDSMYKSYANPNPNTSCSS